MYSAKEFYDSITDYYHMFYFDWYKAMTRHANVIDSLIKDKLQSNVNEISILDCSCGIGTQAIGLSKLGYEVVGTDISENEIIRARKEAQKCGLDMHFLEADFRQLEKAIDNTFDVVLTFDNALPHMLTIEDMKKALNSMYDRITSGGIFMASIRDYDELIKEKPKNSSPYIHNYEDGRKIILQVWDWHESLYYFDQYIIEHKGEKVSTFHAKATYRAVQRDEISNIMNDVGFNNIRWLMPGETGFYQPIVIGEK